MPVLLVQLLRALPFHGLVLLVQLLELGVFRRELTLGLLRRLATIRDNSWGGGDHLTSAPIPTFLPK